MSAVYNAHNDLVDAYFDQQSDIQAHWPWGLIMAEQHEIPQHLSYLGYFELIKDWTHRLSKSPFLMTEMSRDVLARIYYYYIKEKSMSEAKNKKQIHMAICWNIAVCWLIWDYFAEQGKIKERANKSQSILPKLPLGSI